MTRRLNKWLLIASVLALAVSFWHRNDLPRSIRFDPALADEPTQEAITAPPMAVRWKKTDYRVEPLYNYEIHGLVVSYRLHDGESWMHRLSHDRLNVADVCVAWSDTAFSQYLGDINFWNGVFTCNASTRSDLAWSHFRMDQLSNNHLVSADPRVREAIGKLRIGDQIRISGRLVHYGAMGQPMRGTSTTRTDTGDGACETIHVGEFEILRRSPNGWRLLMWLSLAGLVAGLAIHFSLPLKVPAGDR